MGDDAPYLGYTTDDRNRPQLREYLRLISYETNFSGYWINNIINIYSFKDAI